MTLRIATALAFGLIATTASAQGSWTAIGPNGGTGSGTYACSAAPGTVTCNGQGSWTGPNGHVRTWERNRVRTPGSVTINRWATRPNGTPRFTTRTRSW